MNTHLNAVGKISIIIVDSILAEISIKAIIIGNNTNIAISFEIKYINTGHKAATVERKTKKTCNIRYRISKIIINLLIRDFFPVLFTTNPAIIKATNCTAPRVEALMYTKELSKFYKIKHLVQSRLLKLYSTNVTIWC